MSMNVSPLSSSDAVSPRGDDVDLAAIAAVIGDNRLLIAAVTAVTVMLGAGYALLAEPVYRADAIVQVGDKADAVNDKLGDLAQLFGSKATADAEIELIRSRAVIGDTVSQLHLDIDARPRYVPVIGELFARVSSGGAPADPVWGLGRFAWGGESVQVSQFDVPPALYTRKFTLIAGSGGRIRVEGPDGDVVLNGRVGDVLSGTLREGAIRLRVDRVIARPGTEFRLRRASTQLTVAALQKALDVAEQTKQSGIVSIRLDGHDSARTAAVVNSIVRGYVQRNLDWKSAQAEQMLSFLGNQLPTLRRDLDQAEQRYNTFRNRNGTIDLVEEGRLLLQSIVDGKTRMSALQQQRAELLQRFTPTHPSVAAVDAQMADLQRQIDQLDAKVATLPDTQQAALRLTRDVNIDTGLYTSLMDSAQQLRVLKAGQLGEVRVVDYAVAAEEPVKPKKALLIAAAAVLGVLLGMAAALARRAMQSGLDSPIEIEQVAGVPVYAVISHSDRQPRLQHAARRGAPGAALLALAAPDDIAVEGVRSLRTALQFRVAHAPNNVVMLTGPRPNVGKSFLSANLGAVLAALGKRVLIVDADLRRGNLHQYFGLASGPGLQEAIDGASLDTVLHCEVLPNLTVLTRGGGSPAAAETLAGDALGTLVAQLSALYDLVILDTPPVLAVTDAVLIGKHAGTKLLVMRHAQHSVAELRHTTRLLAGAGVTIDGIVLSDVPLQVSDYTYSAYSGTAGTSGTSGPSHE